MPLPRFVLVSFPSLIRKCVAPTGRFHWGQSMKIGLINCKHSNGNPSTSPLHPCCSALTRILGNATSADGVRRINTSSFFVFQRTFSSLHFHRVCKRLSAWSVWLVTTSSLMEEVFGNPNKCGDIIPTRHPGSEMGKNNMSEDVEMLQQISQNCFHAHWRAKTYLRVIGLTLQRMGKIPCLFKKKVIPSSFSLHEVLRIAVAKLEQSLVAEAFDSDFSHQSSPEAADPLCPTFPVLAARVSLNTSWLHLLLLRPQLGFIADVECLVCPQVRPSSLSLRTIHNGSTSSVLPWWFFSAR